MNRCHRLIDRFTSIAATAIRFCGYLAAALVILLLSSCEPQNAVTQTTADESVAPVDPMARDFFFMRNPEILEDLLEQLDLHNIEYWINEDQSIGFYVKDTSEVDRIANESIAVWITSQ